MYIYMFVCLLTEFYNFFLFNLLDLNFMLITRKSQSLKILCFIVIHFYSANNTEWIWFNAFWVQR